MFSISKKQQALKKRKWIYNAVDHAADLIKRVQNQLVLSDAVPRIPQSGGRIEAPKARKMIEAPKPTRARRTEPEPKIVETPRPKRMIEAPKPKIGVVVKKNFFV